LQPVRNTPEKIIQKAGGRGRRKGERGEVKRQGRRGGGGREEREREDGRRDEREKRKGKITGEGENSITFLPSK
jgi:hypothetical protein